MSDDTRDWTQPGLERSGRREYAGLAKLGQPSSSPGLVLRFC